MKSKLLPLSFIAIFLIINSCNNETTNKIDEANKTKQAHKRIELKLQNLLDSIYNKHPNGIGYILHVKAPDQNFSWGGAAGYSDRMKQKPLKKDQPGQIGSITKTYVSATIFRLIEQGKLALFQPIINLIPTRTSNVLTKHGYNLHEITIAHLLSHRSGLPTNGTKTYIEREEKNPKYRWSRDELISNAVSNLEKGELGNFNYSDVNYLILTEIIEEVEETAFYLAMRRLLKFKEIGLNETWFYSLEPDPEKVKKRFPQYKETRNWISTYDESTNWGVFGNAGIYTTAEELAEFCHALSTNNIFEDSETLNLMFKQIGNEPDARNVGLIVDEEQYASQYRMGITCIDGPGFKAFGHDGYWGSLMYHFPEQNISFAFFGLNADEILDFDKLFLEILGAMT